MNAELTMKQKRLIEEGYKCLDTIDKLLDKAESNAQAATKKAA